MSYFIQPSSVSINDQYGPTIMSNSALYIAHQRKSDGSVQSLETHLLEVSCIVKSLAAKIDLQVQGELIGLLHDLSKYSSEFSALSEICHWFNRPG